MEIAADDKWYSVRWTLDAVLRTLIFYLVLCTPYLISPFGPPVKIQNPKSKYESSVQREYKIPERVIETPRQGGALTLVLHLDPSSMIDRYPAISRPVGIFVHSTPYGVLRLKSNPVPCHDLEISR